MGLGFCLLWCVLSLAVTALAGPAETVRWPLAVRIMSYGKYQDAGWAHLQAIGVKYVFLAAPVPADVDATMGRLRAHGLTPLVARGNADLSKETFAHDLAPQLEACELAVFKEFAPRLDSMMIGHAHYPCFETEAVPASLSPAVIAQCLREDLRFEGLVMTDDLDMGAILNTFSWEETIQRAVRAGNELIMICHRLEAAEEALAILERMPAADLDPALEGVARWKTRMAPPTEFSEAAHRALDAEVWDLRVATLGEEEAQKRSPEDGKRSPVETY